MNRVTAQARSKQIAFLGKLRRTVSRPWGRLAELGCDFYNVFAGLKYNDILPGTAWDDFVELSAFLKDSGVDHLKQEALQDMLESSVAAGKRHLVDS